MNTNSMAFVRTNLFAVGMLVLSSVGVLAEGLDPTEPSSQITERLSIVDKSESPTDAFAFLKQLRLKAIVLRDRDNGSALMAMGKAETYLLPVRRAEIGSAQAGLSIRGIRFLLEDFSRSSITLRRVDSDQVLIVQ